VPEILWETKRLERLGQGTTAVFIDLGIAARVRPRIPSQPTYVEDSQHRDNKLVYYIIEEAVQQSNLAASYVRKAPLMNGFEALTSRQINGDVTFMQACTELTVRCEAARAAEMMDRPTVQKAVKIGAAQVESSPDKTVEDQVLAYISSQMKRQNLEPTMNKTDRKTRKPRPFLPCLALDCDD
jgi:hypothetical protein